MKKIARLLYNLSIFILSLSLFCLSCCVSSNKNQEIQHEEDVKQKATDTENPVSSISAEEMRINAVYNEMLLNIKSKDESFSSLDVSWLKSLKDDGKYFYSVGISDLCLSIKDAKRFAQNNAKENLRTAIGNIKGVTVVKTPGWELLKSEFFEITKDGKLYYQAAVLIGTDRNFVIKSE